MNQMQNQYSVESTSYPVTDRSFLQLKLDMQTLHRDIKQFLEGKETIISIDKETMQAYEHSKALGDAYANDEGVQNLYGTIKMIVNEHTVQGNTKDENNLRKFLEGIHEDLTKAVHRNWLSWKIQKNNREFIIDRIMAMTELVLSRTIGNKERESQNPSVMKYSQWQTPKEKGKVM